MPNALPFIGHLHLHAGASGKNDSSVWEEWSKKLGSDLLQVKFGNRRIVVANSYESIKEIFVTNGASTNARPSQYVFEKYVGYDLGSHSLDENFKAQRTAALRSVKTSSWPSFYPCLEREGDRLIANLAEQGLYGEKTIIPLPYMQVVAMALGWSITFGKEFPANDPWLREYIDNACIITKVRGASNTWSDFVPFLRLHPKFRAMGLEGQVASKRRTAMIQEVVEDLKNKVAKGEDPQCVAAQVMTDKNSKLSMWNAVKCSTSMLQGGTESIPSHLTAGFGGLVQGNGPAIQEKAFAAINEAYPNGDAIAHAFNEEKVPYLAAMYKEILRNYVVLPFSLPHAANQDVHLKSGITIPKGTTLYMNSDAGNHGEL
jgi:phenylacetate 2-hydroxylase